jgi:aldose 1-epimerase
MVQESRGVFTLSNANGVEVCTIPRGASITSIKTPDREGRRADIVLGFDDPDDYEAEHPYFGAVVGRYANRIANGRFTLDGTPHVLATNDGPHHLHGGIRGFDKVPWEAASPSGRDSVTFTRLSHDGEEGYPGNLRVIVTYTLTGENELIVQYTAETDRATPVNLTQHTYFNLAGTGDVLDHVLEIDAARFTPVDDAGAPTGALDPVDETPFDFRRPTPIGARLGTPHLQLQARSGYDHNWVLEGADAGLRHVARVHDPISGRTLDLATEEPGLQFYSGNLLDGTIAGKDGRPYQRHSGFCLETQHFPDSPNQFHFPSTILRPSQAYRTRTVFTFGALSRAGSR